MMRAILSSFKNMREDTSKTCTVMLDKDQNEIDAVQNALPAASVLLCHFHVLKYFKKKISELLLPVDEKNELFAQFKALVYAKDAEAFDSMMTKLAEMNEELHQYISKNWQNCKQMWVTYHRQGTITFGNDTNNRTESENSKLKHLLCASSSMSECIRQLCFHNAILDDERQYQQFLSKYTTVQYGNKDEDLSPLYSQFTEHAVNKMLKNHVFPHMPSAFRQQSGFLDSFVQLIEILHNGMTARVIHQNSKSEEITITCELNQGCVFAHAMISLYLSAMLHELPPDSSAVDVMYRLNGGLFNIFRLRTKILPSIFRVTELQYVDINAAPTHSANYL
ncbi:hypothetical protein Pmani_002368 [Petrolisthes manimaculis]|uniref:MULE transposase domain-containing protein n=1 Tax=Petrolisthes manimaculis TaxID=1843537 RepID=A0AAE1UR24_9EUCA|nr:hypothetical protein Pmani_002368 [Petrolisthes manimaculis]